MTEALVTPGVLSWARQRRGLAAAELAPKLQVRPEAIDAWEAGDRRPTFRQAQRLAQTLYIPFGYLFLAAPPVQELPVPDFRTFAGQPPREPSPEFLDLLHDVLTKQQWFREYRESEGVEDLPFVGRFGFIDAAQASAKAVADDIRNTIDVDGARSRAPNWEGFLRELIHNAEGSGIMVLRSGVVGNNGHRPLDIEEFRGFTISHDLAPLIFINGRDFMGAQIFTFAHEVCHIWIGRSGVSNPDYELRGQRQDNDIEQYCNRVAAEILVPSEDLVARWQTEMNIESNVRALTRTYRVSNFVVLRQAHDQDIIPTAAYWDSYRQLVEQVGRPGSPAEPGGNFHYTLAARNGGEFVRAVVSSVADGTLLRHEAAKLLNVRRQTLPMIAEHLFGDRLSLA